MEIHPVRPLTVKQLKQRTDRTYARGGRPLAEKPAEGTAIRRLYDFFVENAGEPVAVIPRHVHNFGGMVNNLTLFWGLNIRRISSGSKRTDRMSVYILSEYWDGHQYIECTDELMIPLLLKLRERSLRL